MHHEHDAMEHEAMDDMEVDNAEDEYEDVSDPRFWHYLCDGTWG